MTKLTEEEEEEKQLNEEVIDFIINEHKRKLAIIDTICEYCGVLISNADSEHKFRCREKYKNEQKEKKKEKEKKLGKNKRWKYELKRKYNLKTSQYYKMLRKQNYKCAICGIDYLRYAKNNKRKIKLSIDHNHITGKIRGLLCQKCNLNIRVFELPKKQKEKLLNYLNKQRDTSCINSPRNVSYWLGRKA